MVPLVLTAALAVWLKMRVSDLPLVVFRAERGKPPWVEQQGPYELHRELRGLYSYGTQRILG